MSSLAHLWFTLSGAYAAGSILSGVVALDSPTHSRLHTYANIAQVAFLVSAAVMCGAACIAEVLA